jgi:uncharacterized membrane protein YfcA
MRSRRHLEVEMRVDTVQRTGQTISVERRRRSFHVRLLVLAAVAGAGLAVSLTIDPVAVTAALGTGFFNTAAGGGAIVTFLALTATGMPALVTHATSQAVTPCSFLVALRLLRDFRPGWRLLASSCAGTLVGVAVLKATPAGTFQRLAPFFLVPAAILVVFQEPTKRWVKRAGIVLGSKTTAGLMFGCGIYAGLIGVGTGTLALVVLGLTPALADTPLPDLLRTRNALLLGMALLVAVAFAATGLVDWPLAALLALPGAVGGWVGTKAVGRLPVPVLQFLIAATAVGGAGWMVLR